MSKLPSLVVGIAGTRGVGKSTLASLLKQLDHRIFITNYADALKADLAPFLREHYGVDVWTVSGKDKEWVRPLLIAHGCAQRERDPDHWVKKVIAHIEWEIKEAERLYPLCKTGEEIAIGADAIPVIPDHRFCSEVTLMRATYGSAFKLINLTREGSPSPTEEEEKHYRQVASVADFHLHWGLEKTEEERLGRAREVARWLGIV